MNADNRDIPRRDFIGTSTAAAVVKRLDSSGDGVLSMLHVRNFVDTIRTAW